MPTTKKMVKKGMNEMQTKRNVAEKAITNHKGKKNLALLTKQTNIKHFKAKKIHIYTMNQTRIWHWINKGHWINQGLLKQMKQKKQ